jgi:hypothetical protein
LNLISALHVSGLGVRPTLRQEGAEHALAVLGGEVHRFDLDADQLGHRHRVDQVLARGAVLVGVVVLPVLHEQAEHLEALFLEQPGRDRGVDPARHADDDAPARHVLASG